MLDKLINVAEKMNDKVEKTECPKSDMSKSLQENSDKKLFAKLFGEDNLDKKETKNEKNDSENHDFDQIMDKLFGENGGDKGKEKNKDVDIDKLFNELFGEETESNDNEFDLKEDLDESGDEDKGENNQDDPEGDDDKELTEDEINEKQRAAIKEAFEKIKNGEKLTDQEKGNLCEMMMDQYYISQGYTPLHDRVTSLDDKGHQGIDGVYEKTNPDGSKSYVIADAKYGQSPLGNTMDGKQMSEDWIDNRLDDSVGKEKADEIRDAQEDNPDSVSHEVYHYEPNENEYGNTSSDVTSVDEDGNKNHDKTVVEEFDEDGNTIEKGEDKDEG